MGLTNNDIFKKLRVANKLRDDDIVKICALAGFEISKSELGAIFRREDHPKYMECGDQLLRNFLDGLIIYKRGPMPKKKPYKKRGSFQQKDTKPFKKKKRKRINRPKKKE